MTGTTPQPTTAPTASPAGNPRLMGWARLWVYAFAFSHFSLVTADPDLWGHIHFGQALLDEGGLITSNPYSYTAQGYRWINHEWLMELLFAFIYGAFDSTGLIFFKTLLGVWIIHLLSTIHFRRSQNVTVYLVLFCLAIPVMALGFMTRPHLATFLGLTLLTVALHKFFDGNHHALRWTPVLFLFWTNSHGGVVAGLGIFGLIVAIETVRCLRTGQRPGETSKTRIAPVIHSSPAGQEPAGSSGTLAGERPGETSKTRIAPVIHSSPAGHEPAGSSGTLAGQRPGETSKTRIAPVIHSSPAGHEPAGSSGTLAGERQSKLLLQTFAVCIVAVLINPYGHQLWLFFMESLGSPRAITEWQPVPPFNLEFPLFKILVLLFAVTWVLPARKRIWEIAVIVLAVIFGFKHQRHTVLAAIVMLPYLCMQFSGLMDRWDAGRAYARLSRHFQWTVNAVIVAFALFFVVDRFQQFADNNYKIWVEPNVYPTYAVHFLEANEIDGNILVPFDWGEYLIWKRPQSRVSIDGRFRTAYPELIIELNRAFSEGRPRGRELLNLFPTNLVLTAKGEAPHRFMENEEDWVKIYQDPISKIFVRAFDPVHPALEKFRSGELVNPTQPATYEFPG